MTKMPIESPALFEETSFWARTYGAYAPNAPLTGDANVDVAIIGGGYTGLSTAIEFKRDNPGSTVAVLEAAVVGFGASGRNGGFNMTLFGLEPELTRLRWGRQRTIDAHRYTQRAVAWVKRLIDEHGLESDYRHTGMLRVSYSPSQLKRLERTLHLMRELGIDDDLTFEPAEKLRRDFSTDRYMGALRERETGILNPCKHVRELKRIAVGAGVQVYESSPVDLIERVAGGVRLRTRRSILSAKKLVLATNAYSSALNGLPQLRARQKPFWTYQVVTAPLDPETWASLRWIGQESFEDNRQLVHYFRPTVDGRITMGGGDVIAPGLGHFDHDFAPHIWRHLESHLKWLFPQLREVPIDYRWGGPVSVNVDMTPQIGFLGDPSVIFSMGCIGHGVSLSHLNGRLIADLLSERQTELSDFWIVNRKAIPWPPEPLSFIGRHAIRRGLQLWDCVEERGLRSRKASKGEA